MTTTAKSIIHRATDLLQDQTSVHWPASELVRWFNDAQRAIVKMRPDALNTTATMTLAAGAKQTLTALTPAASKLIEITRNMAATSTKAAVRKVDRKILDAQIPSWPSLTGSVDILHFMYDERDPKTFWVYPPATTAAQLEIMYSAFPTDVTEPADGATWNSVTGDMSLPDIYADDVLNLIMYRALSKDAEFANAQNASTYLAAVTQSLGAEIAATVAVAPKTDK